jgi:uncharacterized protein
MNEHDVVPRFTVITLGVSEMRRSIAFYTSLGFVRKFRATGEAVAFFDTGGTVIGLYPWTELAHEAAQPDAPQPSGFRGVTLAWNCRSMDEVDAALAFVLSKGATLLKAAQATDYGGYAGYFAENNGELRPVPGCVAGYHSARSRP